MRLVRVGLPGVATPPADPAGPLHRWADSFVSEAVRGWAPDAHVAFRAECADLAVATHERFDDVERFAVADRGLVRDARAMKPEPKPITVEIVRREADDPSRHHEIVKLLADLVVGYRRSASKDNGPKGSP